MIRGFIAGVLWGVVILTPLALVFSLVSQDELRTAPQISVVPAPRDPAFDAPVEDAPIPAPDPVPAVTLEQPDLPQEPAPEEVAEIAPATTPADPVVVDTLETELGALPRPAETEGTGPELAAAPQYAAEGPAIAPPVAAPAPELITPTPVEPAPELAALAPPEVPGDLSVPVLVARGQGLDQGAEAVAPQLTFETTERLSLAQPGVRPSIAQQEIVRVDTASAAQPPAPESVVPPTPPAAEPEGEPKIEAEPEPKPETAPESAPDTTSQVNRLRAFAEPAPADAAQPFAIVLMDQGFGPPPMEELAAFDNAVTIAIDPTLPDAADRMRRYREAGMEVAVIGALSLGPRALAEDLATLPEALAVFDTEGVALNLVPELLDAGVGVLALRDPGLETPVPHLTFASELDANGQGSRTIQRFLGAAAANATRGQGSRVVLGRLRSDTLAAIADWREGRRAKLMTLVPVSTLLRQ